MSGVVKNVSIEGKRFSLPSWVKYIARDSGIESADWVETWYGYGPVGEEEAGSFRAPTLGDGRWLTPLGGQNVLIKELSDTTLGRSWDRSLFRLKYSPGADLYIAAPVPFSGYRVEGENQQPEVDEVEEQATYQQAPLEREIRAKCNELANFLVAKNRAYGNSAADPVAIFARRLDTLAQIDTRIDDKLSRLKRGNEYPGDDTVKDLAGYLILRMIVKEGMS